MKYGMIVCLAWALMSCTEVGKQHTAEAANEQEYPLGVITTPQGEMVFWLYEQTPNHRAKFIELANDKHYDQFVFNRVVKDFVIQGGCPDSVKCFKDSPYLLDPEFVDSIDHHYGALGMGRDNNPAKQSNACQLYIVSNEEGLPWLDGDYMIFGDMLAGFDVLEAIEAVETDSTNTPLREVAMKVEVRYATASEIHERFNKKLP